jgi:hypothetical protein
MERADRSWCADSFWSHFVQSDRLTGDQLPGDSRSMVFALCKPGTLIARSI